MMEADINCMILGYLKNHDFNRTAKEFEVESRYLKKGSLMNQFSGKEYLMPSLSQIVQDYCVMKKAENELIKKGQGTCVTALWRQFDALITQLKLLTMGKQNYESGRSNYRSARNLQYSRTTVPRSSTTVSQNSQSCNIVPTTRLSTLFNSAASLARSQHDAPVKPQDLESNSQDLQSKYPGFQSKSQGLDSRSKELRSESPENEYRSQGLESISQGFESKELDLRLKRSASKSTICSAEADRMGGSTLAGVEESSGCLGKGPDNLSDPDSSNIVSLESPLRNHDEMSCIEITDTQCPKSPKRKSIRPKKVENTPQALSNTELQDESNEPQQRKENPNQLTIQQPAQTNSFSNELNAIFDALLNSKSLQEKIADNINKVATSSHCHINDVSEAQGNELANTLSTINVEEVLNITRSDPSFESLFSALDDIETSPSAIQTPMRPSELCPKESISTTFEPIEDGAIVSEQIEELNSNRDGFTRIENCVRIKKSKTSFDTSKRSGTSVPDFGSTGFQTLQSNPVCNIYIKEKSRVKSGTWKPRSYFTSSAVLTGSGSMSRARLSQTFKNPSSGELGQKEVGAGSARSDKDDGKGLKVMKGRKGKNSGRRSRGKDLVGTSTNKGISAVGNKDRGKQEAEYRCETNSVSEPRKLSNGVETDFSRTLSGFVGNFDLVDLAGSARDGTAHKTANGISAVNAPELSVISTASVSTAERKIDGKSTTKNDTESCSNDIRVNTDEDDTTNHYERHESGASAAILKQVEAIASSKLQLTALQHEGDLSQLFGNVDGREHRRTGMTVRFDLPPWSGDIDEKTEDAKTDISEGVKIGHTSKQRRSPRKSRPRKSILKRGVLANASLQNESSQFSDLDKKLIVLDREEAKQTANHDGNKIQNMIESGTLLSSVISTGGAGSADKPAGFCENARDVDRTVELECTEKIDFNEDDDHKSDGRNEIERIGTENASNDAHGMSSRDSENDLLQKAIDNTVENNIGDLETGTIRRSSRLRKSGESSARQMKSKSKGKEKAGSSRNGQPENGTDIEETDGLLSGSRTDGVVGEVGISRHEPNPGETDSLLIDKDKVCFDGLKLNEIEEKTLVIRDSSQDFIDVNVVIETTTEGDTLAFIKAKQENSKEPRTYFVVKEVLDTIIQEGCQSLSYSESGANDGGIRVGEISDGRITDQSKSFSKSDQDMLIQTAEITHHNTDSNISKLPNQTLLDRSQLPISIVSSINDSGDSLQPQVCASLGTESHLSKQTVQPDFTVTGSLQLQHNQSPNEEHPLTDFRRREIVSDGPQNKSPQTSNGLLPEANKVNTNVGFEIISSEVRSNLSNGSKLDESLECEQAFQPEDFAIYLSDDSNDSTDVRQNVLKRRAMEKSRVKSGSSEDQGLGSHATSIGESDQQEMRSSDGSNGSVMTNKTQTKTLIDNESLMLKSGGKGKWNSFGEFGEKSGEYLARNLKADGGTDQKRENAGGKSKGNKGKDCQAINEKKLTVTKRSKKRKSCPDDVPLPAKKQDKVGEPNHDYAMPKNLDIDQFLSKLKYTS